MFTSCRRTRVLAAAVVLLLTAAIPAASATPATSAPGAQAAPASARLAAGFGAGGLGAGVAGADAAGWLAAWLADFLSSHLGSPAVPARPDGGRRSRPPQATTTCDAGSQMDPNGNCVPIHLGISNPLARHP
jgi:hypothetical protein